jgi:hypothetical protein
VYAVWPSITQEMKIHEDLNAEVTGKLSLDSPRFFSFSFSL